MGCCLCSMIFVDYTPLIHSLISDLLKMSLHFPKNNMSTTQWNHVCRISVSSWEAISSNSYVDIPIMRSLPPPLGPQGGWNGWAGGAREESERSERDVPWEDDGGLIGLGVIQSISQMLHGAGIFIPTKLAHKNGVNVGIHIPAPWFAYGSGDGSKPIKIPLLGTWINTHKPSILGYHPGTRVLTRSHTQKLGLIMSSVNPAPLRTNHPNRAAVDH